MSIIPGMIQFARMPLSANSYATARVKALTAALETRYMSSSGNFGRTAPTEEILTHKILVLIRGYVKLDTIGGHIFKNGTQIFNDKADVIKPGAVFAEKVRFPLVE